MGKPTLWESQTNIDLKIVCWVARTKLHFEDEVSSNFIYRTSFELKKRFFVLIFLLKNKKLRKKAIPANKIQSPFFNRRDYYKIPIFHQKSFSKITSYVDFSSKKSSIHPFILYHSPQVLPSYKKMPQKRFFHHSKKIFIFHQIWWFIVLSILYSIRNFNLKKMVKYMIKVLSEALLFPIYTSKKNYFNFVHVYIRNKLMMSKKTSRKKVQ